MTVNTKKIDPKLIDELIEDCKSTEDFLGESAIIKTLDDFLDYCNHNQDDNAKLRDEFSYHEDNSISVHWVPTNKAD